MLIDRTSRNVAPRTRATAFFRYLTFVIALGAALLGWAAHRLSVGDVTTMSTAFLVVAVIVVVAEARPLLLAGIPDTNGVTITTTFVFASLIHWGLPVALALQSVATLIGERVWHKAWWRSMFNVAQYALSWGAAGLVLYLYGHSASATAPDSFTSGDIAPALAAAAAYFLVNDVLVAYAVADAEWP